MSVRLEPYSCPSCNYQMDAATSVEGDHTPQAGDLSMCLNFGELLRFTETLKVAKLSALEFGALNQDTQSTLRKGRRIIIERGAFKP